MTSFLLTGPRPKKTPETTVQERSLWLGLGLGVLGSVGGALVAGSAGLAAYFARKVVTPEPAPEEDIRILAVDLGPGQPPGEGRGTVTLSVTENTTAIGTYGLLFDGGAGLALVGQIVHQDAQSVTRVVDKIFSGELRPGSVSSFSGATFEHPSQLGLKSSDVLIETPAGNAPAWVVPAADRTCSTWAIMVHGRGARRTEGLRAVPTLQEMGMNSLLMSYRNDTDGPVADGGRYGLGMTEWHDIEAGIAYALEHGATDVVLVGYSMGGAIALQVADQSRFRDQVRALVLDAPVINWMDVLAHQAAMNRVPAAIGHYGQLMLSHKLGKWLTGLTAPVDLRALNWVNRADELCKPTLIMHSKDDDFVPDGPARELAAKNPRYVTLVTFDDAAHTREWNVAPEKWRETVLDWLPPYLSQGVHG